MRLFRWLEQWCRWSDLHAIGNSRLVRSSAIVPIVGYLIILNQHLAGYAQLLGVGDVTWRLYALYVGLSSVGLASIVYAARCPETIKSYRTAVEYALKEDDYFLAGNNFTYIRNSARIDYQRLPEWKRSIPGLTDPDLFTDDLPREQHIIVLMTARWTIRNLSRTPSRMVAGALYSVGFVIVSVPTVMTFWNVLNVIATGATAGKA